MPYFRDDFGNVATVEHFGSAEKARAALESLHNCVKCINCRECVACYSCVECSHCYDCRNCASLSFSVDCLQVRDKADMFRGEPARGVPVLPDIHQKVFAAANQEGALNMRDWHTCATTHCRAGWVVTLAERQGKRLESKTNTLFAAMQIYRASGYEISLARFFDSGCDALEDMRRLAERESRKAARRGRTPRTNGPA